MPYTYIGFLDAPLQNAGKVQNRGWELSANYFDHKGDFSWNVGFNLSSVRNKIVDDSGGIDQKWETTINREGYPIGAYYGLKAIGIYRTEADLNRTNSKRRSNQARWDDARFGRYHVRRYRRQWKCDFG